MKFYIPKGGFNELIGDWHPVIVDANKKDKKHSSITKIKPRQTKRCG